MLSDVSWNNFRENYGQPSVNKYVANRYIGNICTDGRGHFADQCYYECFCKNMRKLNDYGVPVNCSFTTNATEHTIYTIMNKFDCCKV